MSGVSDEAKNAAHSEKEKVLEGLRPLMETNRLAEDVQRALEKLKAHLARVEKWRAG
jgi:hypothetical protein